MNPQPHLTETQLRALVDELINPDAPHLKAAVVEALQGHLVDVYTRIHTELDKAGHTDAAEFVRQNFGG